MTANVDDLVWPPNRLGEALSALAHAAGLPTRAVDLPAPPEQIAQPKGLVLEQWMQDAVGWLGLEVDSRDVPYAEAEQFVRGAGPAILRFPGRALKFLVLIRCVRETAFLLDSERVTREVPVESVREALCRDLETRMRPVVDRLLDEAGIPQRRRDRVSRAVLRERVGGMYIPGGWLLRARPGASFWQQCKQSGVVRRAAVFLCAYVVSYSLWIAAWWTVGRGALEGKLDTGWLFAWALLLMTLVPFRLLASWAGGVLAIDVGGLLKQRLLAGALNLEPEEIRHQGAGQLLGRVMESEAVEALAIGGGLMGFTSVVELGIASLVLAAGARGLAHSLWLLGWVLVSVVLAWLYFRQRHRWTRTRVDMTYDLVERIVGHRTRLAQEPPELWHEGEDQMIERYSHLSSEMDRAQVLLTLIPRGWLLIGVLALMPAIVVGEASPARLAVSLGGILLAQRALATLTTGFLQLTGAAIAWKQVRPLYDAAARAEFVPPTSFSWEPEPERDPVLLEAYRVVFKYPDRAEAALQGLSLRIRPGERLLIEGPSGSGKSTLASVLAGLRLPRQGLLLLGGLDRATLGIEGWRRRAVMAPQFHENYVVTGTFGFNLLMGRRWPALPDDFEEAEKVCRALGLGDVFDRMPGGFRQTVGETGWQLSHGEKSRLYIARALLQGADLVLLDESFAALDPETLQKALGYVLSRGHTLIVIAHP